VSINPQTGAGRVLASMDALHISISFDPLLHPKDAGRFLGIHEKTVIRMARNRQLPALRLGKHWRFRAVDLTRWTEEQVKSNGQP